MELINHKVQAGETLSQIASIYNSSVSRIKHLNPFIRNADRIQAGWNLSIPKPESKVVNSTNTKDLEKPQKENKVNDNEIEQKKVDNGVINLGKNPFPIQSCSAEFGNNETPNCSSEYIDIIYATEEKAFWLLTESAANSIKEASHRLSALVAPHKTPEERAKGLDESGLLDYFLEPKLTIFLKGEQKQRMLEIEEQEPNISNPNYALALKRKALQDNLQKQSRLSDEKSKFKESQKIRWEYMEEKKHLAELNEEWKHLKDIAIAEARKQGYTYEHDMLFTEKAMEARTRVQNYLNKRKAILDKEDTTEYSQEEIAKLAQENKIRFEKVQIISNSNQYIAFTDYLEWRRKNAKKFAYQEYVDSIIALAEYGLATPEYALLGEIESDVAAGIARFKVYLKLEKDQIKINKRLEEKYKSWIEATGRNCQAPGGLVAAERKQWEELQEERLKLMQQAELNIANAKQSRHLLWNPEEFQPKPVERLVKSGFPLREMCCLTRQGKPLEQFSLAHLKNIDLSHLFNIKNSGNIVSGGIKDYAKKSKSIFTQKPGNADGNASKDTPLKIFEQWLVDEGCLRIDDQKEDWFNEQGWFEIEKFYQYLKNSNYEVKFIENSSARQEWGQRLQQMLFRESVRKGLRLFDSSPQAQLIRCLTPDQGMIQTSAKLSGPSFSKDGFKASAEASLDVNLARGEIELFNIDLPERQSAKEQILTYIDYQGNTQKLNIGRFSLNVSARAWGFAGASILLSSKVNIGPGNTKLGVIDPKQDAKREGQVAYEEKSTSGTLKHIDVAGKPINIDKGAQASFNLFAGVQAGIELRGALNWAPPRNTVALGRSPTVGLSHAEIKGTQWLSLARLGTELAIAVGVGAKADMTISLENSRLVLSLKASLIAGPGVDGSFSFEVGYESIIDLTELFRRELYKNNGKPLDWVTPPASDFMSKLNVLGSVGLDVGMVYLMGADVVMSLYEALMSGGKGGPIAHTIINYPNQAELEQWFVHATPDALGPMLMTLIAAPSEFNITDANLQNGVLKEKKTSYKKSEAHLVQQQAIERILNWIVSNSNKQGTTKLVQRQFEESCMRMNKFGARNSDPGKSYCQARQQLDMFMTKNPLNRNERSQEIIELYLAHTKILGANLDGYCKIYDLRKYNKFGGIYLGNTNQVVYEGPQL